MTPFELFILCIFYILVFHCLIGFLHPKEYWKQLKPLSIGSVVSAILFFMIRSIITIEPNIGAVLFFAIALICWGSLSGIKERKGPLIYYSWRKKKWLFSAENKIIYFGKWNTVIPYLPIKQYGSRSRICYNFLIHFRIETLRWFLDEGYIQRKHKNNLPITLYCEHTELYGEKVQEINEAPKKCIELSNRLFRLTLKSEGMKAAESYFRHESTDNKFGPELEQDRQEISAALRTELNHYPLTIDKIEMDIYLEYDFYRTIPITNEVSQQP